MIAADYPDRAVVFQHPARSGQPFASESVIGRKARERIIAASGKVVPCGIDAVDAGVVGAMKFAAKLKVVGRICKDDIDRIGRQLLQFRDTVPDQDAVQWKFHDVSHQEPRCFLWGESYPQSMIPV